MDITQTFARYDLINTLATQRANVGINTYTHIIKVGVLSFVQIYEYRERGIIIFKCVGNVYALFSINL